MKKPKTPAEALAIGMASTVEVGDCLEWTGSMSNHGAMPSVKCRLPGKTYSDNIGVPRLLWEAKNGPVPDGLWLFRKCCNIRCVCLDHFAVGTRKDAIKARKKAGITKHKPTTKIALTKAARSRSTTVNTMEKARHVRELLSEGMPRDKIVTVTGVRRNMVDDIGSGRAWRETGSVWAGLGAR